MFQSVGTYYVLYAVLFMLFVSQEIRAWATIHASVMDDKPARKRLRVCSNHERCGRFANYPYDTCCGACATNFSICLVTVAMLPIAC